jgi:hypothetical protein
VTLYQGFTAAELLGVVAVIGLIVAAGMIGWERYHRPGSPRAHPTPQVFNDPTTGVRMRVWVDPATGMREYRPD